MVLDLVVGLVFGWRFWILDFVFLFYGYFCFCVLVLGYMRGRELNDKEDKRIFFESRDFFSRIGVWG